MDNEHPTRGEYEILEARVDHLEQINARLLARLDALEARSSGLSPIHSEYNTNGEGKKGRIEKMIVSPSSFGSTSSLPSQPFSNYVRWRCCPPCMAANRAP